MGLSRCLSWNHWLSSSNNNFYESRPKIQSRKSIENLESSNCLMRIISLLKTCEILVAFFSPIKSNGPPVKRKRGEEAGYRIGIVWFTSSLIYTDYGLSGTSQSKNIPILLFFAVPSTFFSSSSSFFFSRPLALCHFFSPFFFHVCLFFEHDIKLHGSEPRLQNSCCKSHPLDVRGPHRLIFPRGDLIHPGPSATKRILRREYKIKKINKFPDFVKKKKKRKILN